ncbi:MAG: hypothetical protein HYV28_05245 [Ignavibacteriales bacterium]|nr:hypothetical protein [Ignavibacteriales bacterium]
MKYIGFVIFLLPLLFLSCGYTIPDTERFKPAPVIILKEPFSSDSLKNFHFEYTNGQTKYNSRSGKFQKYDSDYISSVDIFAMTRPEEKNNLLLCLRALGIDTLNYVLDDIPERNDHAVFLEIYSLRKGLRWRISGPLNEVEIKLKDLEDILAGIMQRIETENTKRQPIHVVY